MCIVSSWLYSCSFPSCIASTNALPLNKKPPASYNSPSSTSASTSTSSSLHSNLSIQTNLSVPSLKLPSHGFNHIVSQHCLASLNPYPFHPLTCLIIHGDLLYTAFFHKITICNHCTYNDLLCSFVSQHSSSGDG